MDKINYDNKIFASISNTENGEVNEETIFNYHQNGSYIWASLFIFASDSHFPVLIILSLFICS